MINSFQTQSPARAFTLLEVILAIGVFSIAAIALVQALNIIGLATIEAADRFDTDSQIKGLLNESCFDPNLKVGVTQVTGRDERFEFEVEVTESRLSNQDGANLENMFTVRATAYRKPTPGKKRETMGAAERLVYRELWRRDHLARQ